MPNPMLSRWYMLYNKPTRTEVLFEPAVASLGIPYRAQHLVSCRYILDFALLDDKINIELDGDSHKRPKQIEHDKARDEFLTKNGWRVIRMSNRFVTLDPYAALNWAMTKLGLPHLAQRK